MSALLVYSDKCSHCKDIMSYVSSNTQLAQLVRYHNVNTLGLPPQYQRQITRVPTMLTKNGKILVGKEIKQWLSSLLPVEFTSCSVGNGFGCSSIDGNEEDGNMFSLDNYGQSLQPAITPELQARIGQSVNDAFKSNKR
jgi:hypothetical protein